jgi:hypothetical protein
VSAPFGNRTRGMAGEDIRNLRLPPYLIIESDDPDIWRKVTASLAGEDRLPVRKLRVEEPVAGGIWSALPASEWSSLRVEDEINRHLHAPFPPPLSIDLPDDFDRDIMDAAEEEHPLRAYGRDALFGLAIAVGIIVAMAFAGFVVLCVRATIALWS